MALFSKKKKGEPITLESLLASLFAGGGLESADGARVLSASALASEAAFPGKAGLLAFSDSNAPVAAAVVAEGFRERERSWLAESGLVSDAPLVWSSMEVDGPFADAFRWQALELIPYAVTDSAGKTVAHLCLSEPLLASLKARAEAEEAARTGKRGKKKNDGMPEVESGAENARPLGHFRADRARDLPALSAFCAQSFKAGERVYSTNPSAFGIVAVGAGLPPAPDYPVWFKGSFEYLASEGAAPALLTFIYVLSRSSLPLNLAPADATRLLAALAGGVFAESARRYCSLSATKPGRLALKPMEAPPDLSRAADLLFVDFSVRDSGVSVPAQAIVPAQALLPLARAWKVGFPGVPAKADAATLFDVNGRMLSKALPAIIASPELRPRVPRLCVSELIRLLSDQDARLVVQNVLIPDFGAKDLPGIFFYAVAARAPDGTERQAVMPYGPFDSRRIDSLLPEVFKQGFYEETRALTGHSADSCAERNDHAIHSILRAALGGRIDASGRLKYLLREIVLKEDSKRAEARLTELRAAGVPFALLASLDPKDAQRVAATVDDRDFALALVDSADAMGGMRKYVSMGRTERLREDVTFVKKCIADGTLSLMDSVDAKEKIRAAIERDAERERERAELEARSPARPGSR